MDLGDLRRISVVGIGAMGHGIAQVCAAAGFDVVLMYRRRERLEAALARIRSNLELLVASGLTPPADAEATLRRLSGSGTLAEAVGDVDLVLESLPEDLALKRQVYAELDTLCPPRTILASNTSSFRISELAGATRRPDRVCGIHWVAPAYVVPVVEVIAADATAPETAALATGFVRRVGKVPIVAKDVPGFVLVRLVNALYNEAMSLVAQGIASPHDVDTGFRLGVGLLATLLGPLRQADLAVNKHTTASVLAYLYRETGETKFRPLPILAQQIAAGRLGLAWGKGWYDYGGLDPEAVRRWRDGNALALVSFLRRQGLLADNPLGHSEGGFAPLPKPS